ncbi:MAG: hypothetical protein ACRDTM_10955, partial [Micromonosporaceae bacterium]
AVLVLVAGSAALLTGIGKTERTPSADDSPTRTVSESPSAPASTPSRTPDDKPTRSSPGAPRGIRDIDLRNITVRLEPLGGTGCGGSVTFRGGTANTGGCVWKIAGGGVKYANLDGVAGEEAVTTIGAGPPNAEYTNGVIAFRSVATGGVESIGYVYVADNSSQIVQAFWVGDSGAVTVQIQDISWDPQQPQTQDRTYRWGGSAFGQIGGPTAFPSPSPEPTGSEPEPSPTPSGE